MLPELLASNGISTSALSKLYFSDFGGNRCARGRSRRALEQEIVIDFASFAAAPENRDIDIRLPEIGDTGIWVTQAQGPNAMKVLANVIDGPMPEPFNYF